MYHGLGHSDDSEGETINHPDRTLLSGTWTTIQHQQTISTTRGRDYSKGTDTNTRKKIIKWSFIHPHVVTNLWDFLSSLEHKLFFEEYTGHLPPCNKGE